MIFLPASAASFAAAVPAMPMPMTSTSQSFSSLTSVGTGGGVRKSGVYLVGETLDALPPFGLPSPSADAVPALCCGAQPAKPAAPAATAAVAPKPRNARRLSLVSFMSLSPFDEKRVGFPLPASSRGFPVWNPPLRCQPYAPASLPATPAGGWFFAFRPVRSPPDTGRVSDRMPDGTVYEYAFAVAGAVLGLEP